jgi:hypothetical protein
MQTQINNPDHARLVHHRVLETLGEVMSELSTRLLSAGRKQFAEIAPNIFQAVAQIYVVYVDRTIIQLANIDHVEGLLLELDIVGTCVRCLRILMVSGIRDVHKYNETRVSLYLISTRKGLFYLYIIIIIQLDLYSSES